MLKVQFTWGTLDALGFLFLSALGTEPGNEQLGVRCLLGPESKPAWKGKAKSQPGIGADICPFGSCCFVFGETTSLPGFFVSHVYKRHRRRRLGVQNWVIVH